MTHPTDFERWHPIILHPSRFWLPPIVLVILVIVLIFACLKMWEWSEDIVARRGPPSSSSSRRRRRRSPSFDRIDDSRVFSVDIREVSRYYEGV